MLGRARRARRRQPRRYELLWIPANEVHIAVGDAPQRFIYRFSKPDARTVPEILDESENLPLFWQFLMGKLGPTPYATKFWEMYLQHGSQFTQHKLQSLADAERVVSGYGKIATDVSKLGRLRTRLEMHQELSERHGPRLIVDAEGHAYLRYGGGMHRFLIAHLHSAWVPFALEALHPGAKKVLPAMRERRPS